MHISPNKKSTNLDLSQSFFSLGQWKYNFFTQKDVEMPHFYLAKVIL